LHRYNGGFVARVRVSVGNPNWETKLYGSVSQATSSGIFASRSILPRARARICPETPGHLLLSE
jgi:hypothetical protein